MAYRRITDRAEEDGPTAQIPGTRRVFFSGERLERFKELVTERICGDGAFRIRKSSGMFVARKARASE